jgi:hypothetical protein
MQDLFSTWHGYRLGKPSLFDPLFDATALLGAPEEPSIRISGIYTPGLSDREEAGEE